MRAPQRIDASCIQLKCDHVAKGTACAEEISCIQLKCDHVAKGTACAEESVIPINALVCMLIVSTAAPKEGVEVNRDNRVPNQRRPGRRKARKKGTRRGPGKRPHAHERALLPVKFQKDVLAPAEIVT